MQWRLTTTRALTASQSLCVWQVKGRENSHVSHFARLNHHMAVFKHGIRVRTDTG